MSSMSKMFKENLITNNMILVQILGICSALAVTNNIANTLVMGVGVTFVTSCSSFTVSLVKDFIPRNVRMIFQTVVIAAFTVIVDMLLKAYDPEASKSLGPYVGLIITNCIIMGRLEAYAQMNTPIPSLIDGFSSSLGYMAAMLIVAFFREILASGTLLNIQIMPEIFTKRALNWTIMNMAPSAFFFIGFIIWILNSKLQGGKNGS